MKMKFEWESIDTQNTRRAKVLGGWIVKTHASSLGACEWAVSETATFISDPNHEWEIE